MKKLLPQNPLAKIALTAVTAALLLPVATAAVLGTVAFYGLAAVGMVAQVAAGALAGIAGWSVGGWLSYHSVRRFAVRSIEKASPLAIDTSDSKLAGKISERFVGVAVKSPAGQGADVVATPAAHHVGADNAPPAPAQGHPPAARKPA